MNYFHLRFPNGKFKALTLSYDDGTQYDKKFIETLNKYGLKATLNVNSNYLPLTEDSEYAKTRASLNDLKEFIKQGHEIAVHGASHVANGIISIQDGVSNTLLGRHGLENALNTIVRGMAYADMGIDSPTYPVTKEKVKAYLSDLGLSYARTASTNKNNFNLPCDFYEWTPTVHFIKQETFDLLNEFIDLKLPPYVAGRRSKLFFVWGHAYEFEKQNLWEELEKFCKLASNKEDIWYATNIEIYDYIDAYSKLQFNIDKTICHNPTATTVWFETEGKIYKIEPNETLYF